jgi:hypothetical protein
MVLRPEHRAAKRCQVTHQVLTDAISQQTCCSIAARVLLRTAFIKDMSSRRCNANEVRKALVDPALPRVADALGEALAR